MSSVRSSFSDEIIHGFDLFLIAGIFTNDIIQNGRMVMDGTNAGYYR